MKDEIKKFRDGIFALNTRRFGKVAELMIEKLYGFEKSKNLAYDLHSDESGCIEVKFSTVLKKCNDKITEDNVINQCIGANTEHRFISSDNMDSTSFDCNIQQVKPKEFNELYYGTFSSDKIEIFQVDNQEVTQLLGYSDKQHRGNKGEGQFHLKDSNINYHREHFKKKELSYEELHELFNSDK